MIIPVNGHILVEPVVFDQFMATNKETYEEVGVVVELDKDIPVTLIRKGDKVFFDSWMIAKYPKNDKEDYWLVKWEDVRAIQNAQD